MERIEVFTRVNGKKKRSVIYVDLGDDLKSAVRKFGEECVHEGFKRRAIQSARKRVRKMIANDEDISKMQTWSPEYKKQGQKTLDRAKEILAEMTPEDINKFFHRILNDNK